MQAELISVGTELLLGEIIDTNSAWLAQDLAQLGADVYWSLRVGDNLERLTRTLEQALARSDLVVLCGGLGPTDDDLTREAVARVLGETPAVEPALEAQLRRLFTRFSRAMPEKNLKQAWLIPSAESLANPNGTAPGWYVRKRMAGKERILVALPGPPKELVPMWLNEVRPRLPIAKSALFIHLFKTYGLGESLLAERLGELTLGANPSAATYAKRDGVHLRVAAKAETTEAARVLAGPVVARVREALAGHVWGENEDTLPEVIRHKLAAAQRTVATMESLTGGSVGAELSSVPGASAVYAGGVVAYTAQAKRAFGVSERVLEASGSISEEAALAMAEASARQLGADYGLATTGVAGPKSSEGKEVGQVHLAVASPEGHRVKTLHLPALSRDMIRERATFAALALLWSVL
ncbi:MAG: competence/damage-inducible protein A [Deinococcota bacterium]|jgi:nicotinamide-nucleotide amidase|nr:competence/damage-inducible protein A [Deinococcota bacterium]